MQDKYIKDLALAIVVIALIVFSIRNYYLYNRVSAVPDESIYSAMALDAALLNQIQQIEESIRERKDFRFTVNRDPLRQDLIVQTRLDLLHEWEQMVRRMMRLSATYFDESGNQIAMIAWNGTDNVVRIGDVLNNRRITGISENSVTYTEAGSTGTMNLQPVPPRPVQLDSRQRSERAGNR
jgi:hypothetical protein